MAIIELLTQGEAARILRVDRTTLSRWQRERHVMPTIRVGRRPVYDKRDVEAYLVHLETYGWPKPGRRPYKVTKAESVAT